ncbi:MAG TPA: DNA topoisomerase IV subunit A [Burkholderiales bacterium]|nr:DNA topoisomerase IV subunit A [Burkholderiales bacterium]
MDQIDLFQADSGDEALNLGRFAEKAYLDYAISVVKGRALPDLCDGQKPVQRRILYAMNEMGLNPSAKPVKSARVVGDVLGKFHPHGDQSAYDAMVRLAQDFSMRYPLVEGHGNFGSRDGDGAAAMRYTEARLTAIASLLLSEIDMGTVDFSPNYDGAFKEPKLLPARLPMVLLNGASGIAVGMATEIPSHNLREVSDAAIALIRNPKISAEEILGYIKGPDFPGGGQIISTDFLDAYRTGRGSLKVRARWKVEELARGQWQLVIFELPPMTSSQKVLEEIEEITNPKVRMGKKALSQEQVQLKQLFLSQLDSVRDESGKTAPVRLVFEPKSSRQDPDEFASLLFSKTGMESSHPINMVMIGLDGRPRQKGIVEILKEWTEYRFGTVKRRTAHRLGEVEDRIHILEGRHVAFLNIDEVIRIIRGSDEPKNDLMERFSLSARQAEDILEIRLRQLARLEGIRIEQELGKLKTEREELEKLLSDPSFMKKKIIREIESDAKTYGDERRTLIEAASQSSLSNQVVDEPITLTLSEKGWIRSRSGHHLETPAFKEGDEHLCTIECRSIDQVALISSNGKAYTLQASQVPGGRGYGVPISTLIDLSGRTISMLKISPGQSVLISNSGGYGFCCKSEDLLARTRSGKQFVALEEGDALLPPILFDSEEDRLVAALSSSSRLLLFPLDEMKTLKNGGRGVLLMSLEKNERLLEAAISKHDGISLRITGRGGKESVLSISEKELLAYIAKRARKGKPLPVKGKACGFLRESS